MAFGSGPLGGMPIGVDPPTFGPEYQRVAPPAAVYFDPRTGDFRQDAAGRILNMGTVEQQVALAFSVTRRSVKHAPDVGHDFLALPRVHGARLDAAIDRAARQATPFDRLLADGLVELLGVEKTHPKDTETRLVVHWRKTGTTTVRNTPVGTS